MQSCLSVSLSACLSLLLCLSVSLCLSFYLSVYLCLSVCMSFYTEKSMFFFRAPPSLSQVTRGCIHSDKKSLLFLTFFVFFVPFCLSFFLVCFPSICLFINAEFLLGILFLSFYSLCMSVCLSACLSVCLSEIVCANYANFTRSSMLAKCYTLLKSNMLTTHLEGC